MISLIYGIQKKDTNELIYKNLFTCGYQRGKDMGGGINEEVEINRYTYCIAQRALLNIV